MIWALHRSGLSRGAAPLRAGGDAAERAERGQEEVAAAERADDGGDAGEPEADRVGRDGEAALAVAVADDGVGLCVQAEEAGVGEPGLLDELEAARDAGLQAQEVEAARDAVERLRNVGTRRRG